MVTDCLTKEGKVCIFPWIDSITKMEHTGCVNGSEGDWCPTAVNEHGVFELKSKKWGLCGENCPSDYGKT